MSDKDGGEADNKDEAIVPTDMNLICDDDLRIVLKPLKEGVKFTMVRSSPAIAGVNHQVHLSLSGVRPQLCTRAGA